MKDTSVATNHSHAGVCYSIIKMTKAGVAVKAIKRLTIITIPRMSENSTDNNAAMKPITNATIIARNSTRNVTARDTIMLTPLCPQMIPEIKGTRKMVMANNHGNHSQLSKACIQSSVLLSKNVLMIKKY